MPKVERTRTRHHSAAVGSSTRINLPSLNSSSTSASASTDWQHAPSSKKKKGSSSSGGMNDDIEVTDADLVGLDVHSSANESEASKRSAMAEALKDLIGMEDDDDEEDDEDDDEDGEGGMTDFDMMKMPAKGTLFKSAKKTTATSSSSAAPKASKQPAQPTLEFAPSLPSRSTQNISLTESSDAAVEPTDTPLAKIKATKIDKRAARHNQLMQRLGLPGTQFGGRGQKKHHGAGGALNSMRDLQSTLLTPQQQNARTLAMRRDAQEGEKRDVLFLSDSQEQARLKELQAQLTKQKKAAKQQQQQQSNGASTAASSSAAPHAQPTTAAPSSTPTFHQPKPLSAAAKRNLHRSELAQYQAVLSHSQFQASPLQALQMHLKNSVQMEKLEREMEVGQQPAQTNAHQQKKGGASHKKKGGGR